MSVPFEEAIASVLGFASPKGERTVLPSNAAGEVVSRNIVAGRNIPPFPRAAMDGFALQWTGSEDKNPYRIIGTVSPGEAWAGPSDDAVCVKIMTGASVPQPFDTVIAVEQSEVALDGGVRFHAPASRGQNIAGEGEDARRGDVVIQGGTLLHPRHIATLAAVGCWEVPVSVKPSVAVLATGGGT